MPKTTKNDKEKAKKYERARILANERARRYKAKKTEEQLEKKREQDRKSAEKRRRHVKDMTEKEKKAARKVWRERKRNLRKKQKENEDLLENNTPPESDNEEHNLPCVREQSRQRDAGKKIARKNRLNIVKELKDAKDEIKEMKRKLEKYKKRLQREKNKKKTVTGVSPSPKTKLNEIVRNEKVSPKIRKQLFSGLVLEKQIKNQIDSVNPKTKLRQVVTKAVGNELLKKYRLQHKFKSIVPYSYNRVLASNKPILDYNRQTYETVKVKEARLIRDFYEDDMVSKMMPGKRDYVQKGKIKIQKRILLDSLYNLYNKFVEDTSLKTISRSVFYRCRPWWVYRPTMKDRETCACIKHENLAFLVSALKYAKVILYKDADDLLKNIVCSVKSENCMMGLCSACKENKFKYTLTDDDEMKFHKWQTITENRMIKGTMKPIKRVEKTTVCTKKSTVVNYLQNSIALYKKHVFNMYRQAKALKTLKKDINSDEILFQVDFSQNYVAKFTSEIQSVHFGASQKQISLHTGARYLKQNEQVNCTTFCTVSDNLDHQAHGVWSHLKPILNDANNKFPNTKTVHFFTDSPSSQYRNKTNVFLMKLLLPEHFEKLQSFSWNYTECGHGKGVMDGVGGSMKRNSDLQVLNQHDITCAKDLVQLFPKSKTKIVEVTTETFDEIKSMIPPKLNTIDGIMSVKQITWSKNTGTLQFRSLSCFECPLDKQCVHNHLFSIGADGKVSFPSKTTMKTGMEVKKSNNKENLKKKKTVLKVSDVYSDEEEDLPQNCVNLEEKFGYDDLKQGQFIVVSFQIGKKQSSKKDYVAIIQNVENLDERELNVMFFKGCNNDNTLFFPDESDESYISVDQVKGILPIPTIVFKGNRLFYKFSGPVCLQ